MISLSLDIMSYTSNSGSNRTCRADSCAPRPCSPVRLFPSRRIAKRILVPYLVVLGLRKSLEVLRTEAEYQRFRGCLLTHDLTPQESDVKS